MKPKALKDCRWEVSVICINRNKFTWLFRTNDNHGMTNTLRGTARRFKFISGAKKNWEAFVKLNGFKKWSFK